MSLVQLAQPIVAPSRATAQNRWGDVDAGTQQQRVAPATWVQIPLTYARKVMVSSSVHTMIQFNNRTV